MEITEAKQGEAGVGESHRIKSYISHNSRIYGGGLFKPLATANKKMEDLAHRAAIMKAWFDNRMCLILMLIEIPRFKDLRTMLKNEMFLEDIERHFIESGAAAYFRNAFRYLRCYFGAYPCVKRRQSEKAIEMIGRIYHAMGYEFHYSTGRRPVLAQALIA